MGLDTRYIPSKYFQEYLVDKDSGCPLAGGIVTFYRDAARTELKPVYQLTGSPPNYSYAALPNPITLSSIGTFQDGTGNDIIPYFYPYDDNGDLDLYYITVESSGSVFQFSREGEPNLSEEEDVSVELSNYIPNGQFLLHNDIYASEENVTQIGQITKDITNIAQGNWTYERTEDSTAVDYVLFERFGSYTDVPQKSPRYSCRIKSDTPVVTDAFKHLAISYSDVNKFSSDTRKFTFAFQGKSNLGGSFTLEVKLIKNFGTNGDPQEETVLQTIDLTTDYTIHDITFTFGSNDGKAIGDDDTDYLQLVLSFPPTTVFDASFDNFLLTSGEYQVTEFPDIKDEKFINDSLITKEMLPEYDGSNLYLPVRLGQGGLEYDREVIGNFVSKSYDNLAKGERWCDGSKYLVSEYSGDGIPNNRLYNVWSSQSPTGLSIYGPGNDEMILEHAARTLDQEFTDDYETLGSIFLHSAWQSLTAGITGNMTAVAVEVPSSMAGKSVTLKIFDGEGTSGTELNSQVVELKDGWNSFHLTTAVSVTATQQYTIYLGGGSNYIKWRGNSGGEYSGGRFSEGVGQDACFKTWVDSVISDIYRLYSTTGGAVTSIADGSVPTGFTFTPVQPDPYIVDIYALVASSITPGAYFIYYTTDSRKYIVWYSIDASGTKPTESADVYRNVSLLSTDTVSIVANKTAVVINSYSYRVPDARGYFLRIQDEGAGIDPDASFRTNRGDGATGDLIGTLQTDEIKAHMHTALQSSTTFNDIQGASDKVLPQIPSTLNTSSTGGAESRPININIKLAVKY